MSDPVDVCVVGAGVAGLVVAAETARAGLRTVVLERDDRVGGMLQPVRLGGVDLDAGADAFATRTDAVPRLVGDLGLALDIVDPDPAGAWLVYEDGGPRRAPLPARSVLGIPADLTAPDLIRITGAVDERPLPPPSPDSEPPLDTLVRDRLGDAVTDVLVDTICRSVYSRPAAAVRLSRVHPALWTALQAEGSLSRAAAAVAAGPQAGGAVRGIRGGMWRLPVALADLARLAGAEIRTGVAATGVASRTAEATVGTASGPVTARRVVLALGAREAARLQGRPAPAAVPVAVATVLIHGTALAARPVGSGAIVSSRVRSRAKALTHVDAKWAWVREALRDGDHIVRISSRADGDWLGERDAVADEIGLLTGIRVPSSTLGELVVHRWDAAADVAADPVPGDVVAVTGAAAAGTGLAAVIPHARRTAAALLRATGSVRT